MAEKYNFTNEAKTVFNYIKTDLAKRFPSSEIGTRYYIYSVMQNKGSAAYKTLEKIVSGDSLVAMEEACYGLLSSANGNNDKPKYNSIYDKCLSDCGSDGRVIDSCSFLVSILSNDKVTAKFLNRFGVTVTELKENMIDSNSEKSVDTPQSTRAKKANHQSAETVKKHTVSPTHRHEITEVEKQLVDVSRMAEEGRIDDAIGCEKTINRIFTALLKRDKNNVVLVGESGSGKTCTVQHIANMIADGNVPTYFADKRLVRIDVASMLSGTGFRGSFEAKYQALLDIAAKSGKYIFFLDDIHTVFSLHNKLSESSVEMMVQDILSNNRIMFITTSTYDGYSKYIASNKGYERRFEKIEMEPKRGEELVRIVNRISAKYEKYHNVKYKNDVVSKAIEFSDRFMGGSNVYTIADILDSAAAYELIKHGKDEKLDELTSEYDAITAEIESFSSSSKSYDVYDDLCRKQIEKQSEINRYKKENMLSKKPIPVTSESICRVVSEKSGIPAGTVGSSEKGRLVNMSKVIKEKVIGQDEAVEIVCQAVKRQRVGIANPNVPVVLMFVGTTGVGKTYLAKKISEEVFGDEKCMVRLDMSEYADKISTNKLIGSASGYVGYEEGGILTEAIKKNNHCVLLLDEIEKANEAIFNMFLQVFDEGRLTDNKGYTVDFRNVIIIMTSNIGTKEASEFKGLIGYGDRKDDMTKKDIILKTIKKELPPEFINRVDEIVFFNNLTDDNLKEIIKIEISKVGDRVKKLGYSLDKSITEGKLVDDIFETVKEESEYGARPILRELQKKLEDRLTDYILANNVKKGHTFKYQDIYGEKEKE